MGNDHDPAPSVSPETAPLDALNLNDAKLVEFPFRLVRSALPHLRRQGGANIVMVTSKRTRLPLSGAAFPDAARAAANALVRSLAIDCARDGVIIKAVVPNVLYSEADYPSALFRDSDHARAYLEHNAPVGRLAEPRGIGDVIIFLATVQTRFLTGSIIDFSGGWPFAVARPSL
ncbi:MAG: SDR family oxidoreductase [Hyphomicrobiales bacterium]|nr:SDR family oxidoreductase [Hyphomicrobiales bacterium]